MGSWLFNAKENIKGWAWFFSAAAQIILIILFFASDHKGDNPISYVATDVFIVIVAWLMGATVGVVIEIFNFFKRFKRY